MATTTLSPTIEKLRFLSPQQATEIAEKHGTPVFVYDEATLQARASEALAFKAPYGLTVRYAMKANPLAAILKTFKSSDIHIDASSGFEAERAIMAGYDPAHIMITSQELPQNLRKLIESGVKYNACSLHQLDAYGKLFPGTHLAVRINIGVGSGHTRSVSVAGPTASFGVWHEHLDQIDQIASKHALHIETIHSHVGCGSDPIVWQQAAKITLGIVEHFPDATTLNLGGGFKVARMSTETATSLEPLGEYVAGLLREFADRTKRELKLEIEPGTFLVANAGTLISRIQDTTYTGKSGFRFLKLDTGMNDLMRPALHAAQQPIVVINDEQELNEYVVVGHNCESTDLLTPAPGDSEVPHPRLLNKASIGDLVAIEGVGAYGSAMRLVGYNSFPTPSEVMLTSSGAFKLIKHKQSVEDLTRGEVY